MCRCWSFLAPFAGCGCGSLLLSNSHISLYLLSLHYTPLLYSSQVVANAVFTVKPHYVNVFTFSHDFVFCMTYQNCTATTAQPASSPLLSDSSQSSIRPGCWKQQAFQRQIKSLSLVMSCHDGLVELNGAERVLCWCLYFSVYPDSQLLTNTAGLAKDFNWDVRQLYGRAG